MNSTSRAYTRTIADNLERTARGIPLHPIPATRPSEPIKPRPAPFIPTDHNAPATRPRSAARTRTRLRWHPGRILATAALTLTLATLAGWAFLIATGG